MLFKKNITHELIFTEEEFLKIRRYAVDKISIDYNTIFDTAIFDTNTKVYHLFVNKCQYKLIAKLF